MTCSPHNFAYVASLGADAFFDHNDAACSQKIKEFSKDSIAHACDCIASGSSPSITVSAMSSQGGTSSSLLPVPDDEVHKVNEKVENRSTLAYTVFGEGFTFGEDEVPAMKGDFEYAKMFWNCRGAAGAGEGEGA